MTYGAPSGFYGHANIIPPKAIFRTKLSLDEWYDAMASVGETGVGQFNHPGDKWGNFNDFKYDPRMDDIFSIMEIRITEYGISCIEEEYDRALRMGWHISPVSNEDTHGANWTTGREETGAVLAEELTRENILDGMRKNRTYATTDRSFKLFYKANGEWIGSRLKKTGSLKVEIDATTEKECGIGVLQLIGEHNIVLAQVDAGREDAVSLSELAYLDPAYEGKEGEILLDMGVAGASGLRVPLVYSTADTATNYLAYSNWEKLQKVERNAMLAFAAYAKEQGIVGGEEKPITYLALPDYQQQCLDPYIAAHPALDSYIDRRENLTDMAIRIMELFEVYKSRKRDADRGVTRTFTPTFLVVHNIAWVNDSDAAWLPDFDAANAAAAQAGEQVKLTPQGEQFLAKLNAKRDAGQASQAEYDKTYQMICKNFRDVSASAGTKSLQRFTICANSALRNRRWMQRSVGGLPFWTSAPQVERESVVCALEEPVAPPQPSRPVRPPRSITTSPGAGCARRTWSRGVAAMTAPSSMRLATKPG
jgi:hypothetical protein